MNLSIPNFLRNLWERNSAGENWYFLPTGEGWDSGGSNLIVAQNHPILTPALMFVSKVFSQAEFYIEDKRTGERDYNHPLLTDLNNPNYYQTRNDFLEELMFMQIACGVAIVYTKKLIGMGDVASNYVLNPNLIVWPEDFKTPLVATNANNPIQNKTIKYDPKDLNIDIKIGDLMFFYDMPNGLQTQNMFKNQSRLDGLKQTLINTNDSLVAKNIILKSNGKELVTGNKDGFPLDADEKADAETLFNKEYGLTRTRRRALITKANITWKSLHIALRDLGLDESVKVDGNLIYTALHIPKDILSLEAKKTTYNNFKESMVSYIQNEIQPSMDAFCAVLNKKIEDQNYKLVGSYEHLPIMQYIRLEQYDVVKKQAEALTALLAVGVPEKDALFMCGMPTDWVLTPPEPQTTNNSDNNQNNTE